MTSALEKAARAAYEETARQMNAIGHPLPDWEDINDAARDSVRLTARAVLMAVREPGTDVGLAGAEHVNRNMRGSVKADYCAAQDSFAAMIDEILATEKPE